jgi:hypothetical protein
MIKAEISEHSKVQELYRRMAYEAGMNGDYTIDVKTESAHECSHRDYILELLKIEDLVNLITSNDLPGFSIKEIRNGKPILTRHPLAKYFKLITELFELVSSEYGYSPNVELFFESCFKLELGKEYLSNPLAYGNRPIRQFEIFNELIELIRTKSRTQKFRSRVASQQYKSTYRLESSKELIDEVFENYASVEVLRIDFSFKYPDAEHITAEQARAYFKRFLNNRRHNKSLFKYFLTYIWKLEWGPDKGYHFHLIFFYNGRYVCNDSYWSNQLCKYWEEVTGGIGQSYDCNRDKDRYIRRGIGTITRKNDSKRKILLEDVVGYLTKTDQCLQLKKLGKDRCYGMGKVPEKSNAGRPRDDV